MSPTQTHLYQAIAPPPAPGNLPGANLVELYPYQKDAVQALRDGINRGLRRQVLCAPTGSGKTEIAMRIVADAMLKGSRCVFVADRQVLVEQTSGRFASSSIKHRIVMGEHTPRWMQRLVQEEQTLVCSAQTLESRGFGWVGRPDLVIIDECHEIRKKLVAAVKEEDICTIGLSATPFVPKLGKHYEDVVNVTTTNELVRTGYLAPLKVVGAQDEVDVAGLRLTNSGEWVRREVGERVAQIVGSIVPEWERRYMEYYGFPAPTIVFCPTVADSEATAEKFQQAGYDFQVVHHKQPGKVKDRLVRRFKRGEFIGLVNCCVLTKGFDAPETRIMVDAYPLRKSLAMHVQKVGRVMRTAEGKDFGLVIDHAGNWLGFMDDTHKVFAEGCPTLKNEKLAKSTRKPPEQTKDHKCRECGFIMPRSAKRCPACGAERPRPRGRLVERAGKLGEIDVVDGKGKALPYDGDWWVEICAVATQLNPTDMKKARKMAFAKYNGIFGKGPGRYFEPVHRPPHPKVERYCYNQYRRWQRRQNKKSA